MLERGVQGNLLRRLHDRHRPSIPYNERKWIDIEPGVFDHGCFGVSKLVRHDESVQEDGAVRFDELASIFRSEFDGTSHCPIRAWISFLAKGGGQTKSFLHCLNPNSSEHFLYFRAIQGHSGSTLVDILPCNTTYCYRTTSLSTSTTSGTLTTCTPSSSVDQFGEDKVEKGTGSQCS